MTPGAVACVLYARIRATAPGFELEGEECPGSDDCFIVTASWPLYYGCDSRTYTSQLVIDVADVLILLRRAYAVIVRAKDDARRLS